MYFLSRKRHLHYFRPAAVECEALVTPSSSGGSAGHPGIVYVMQVPLAQLLEANTRRRC